MTSEEKLQEVKDFLKEAFCTSGDVKWINRPKEYTSYFELRDSKRGVICVSIAAKTKGGE